MRKSSLNVITIWLKEGFLGPKTRRTGMTVMCLMVLLGFSGPLLAEGLLGEYYGQVKIGTTLPGNDWVEDIDDSLLTAGFFANIPVTPNVDLALKYQYSDMDGDVLEGTFTEFHGYFFYHFKPEASANPFLGLGVNYSEIEGLFNDAGVFDKDEKITEPGFSVTAGYEFEIKKEVSIKAQIEHLDIYDDTEFRANGIAHIWFSDTFGMSGEANYSFDAEDWTFLLGITLVA